MEYTAEIALYYETVGNKDYTALRYDTLRASCNTLIPFTANVEGDTKEHRQRYTDKAKQTDKGNNIRENCQGQIKTIRKERNRTTAKIGHRRPFFAVPV